MCPCVCMCVSVCVLYHPSDPHPWMGLWGVLRLGGGVGFGRPDEQAALCLQGRAYTIISACKD